MKGKHKKMKKQASCITAALAAATKKVARAFLPVDNAGRNARTTLAAVRPDDNATRRPMTIPVLSSVRRAVAPSSRLVRHCAAALAAALALATASAHAATYYVSPGGSDTAAGTSWATAKKTIQAAIDASTAGDTITVTNGTYGVISTANKAITIQSVNGASVTIIDGGGANRCATLGTASGETNTVLTGFTLRNGYVRVNTGSAFGGGVLRGTLNNCTLTENTVIALGSGFGDNGYGGGASGSNLNNCMLTKNTVTTSVGPASGGGVSGGWLNNCTLTENTVTTSGDMALGGGASGSRLNNGTLTGNKAISNHAFGMAAGGGAEGGSLNNCTLAGNTVSAYRASGGGASLNGSSANNCVFTGNKAISTSTSTTADGHVVGGGVSLALYGTLNNCTVVGNTVSSAFTTKVEGGGVYLDGSTCIVNNCIIWDNSRVRISSATMDNCANNNGIIRYSCTTPLPSGTGNITSDPLFVNAASGNYRLQSTSPCINKGNNDYVVGTTDLDGNQRIHNGTVDMGAYEYGSSPMISLPTMSQVEAALNLPQSLGSFTCTGWTGTYAIITGSAAYDGVSAVALNSVKGYINVSGAGTLKFWYKVDAGGSLFVVAGHTSGEYCLVDQSGTRAWTQASQTFTESGTHQVYIDGWDAYIDKVEWTPAGSAQTYTVTLNPNGGSGGTASVTATAGAAMPSATAPTRSGHTFLGYWDTDAASGGAKYYNADMSSARAWDKAAAATLYARWTAVPTLHTITFHPNGGGTPVPFSTKQIAMNAPYDVLPTIQRANHRFLGWHTAQTGGTRVWSTLVFTGQANLYAQWEAGEDDTTPGYGETTGWAARRDASWSSGSITTAAQLAQFAWMVRNGSAFSGATVTLGADIDLTGYDWIPAGTAFRGVFNGNSRKITGLRVTGVSEGGFFRSLDGASTVVRNMTFVKGSVTCSDRAGTVAGTGHNARIENVTLTECHVEGTDSGAQAGGLVGEFSGGTVTGCRSERSSVTSAGFSAGGFMGCNEGTDVSQCDAVSVTLLGTGFSTRVGGIVGWLSHGTLTDCTASGTATGTGSSARVGGIFGLGGGTVVRCHSSMTVLSAGYAGGIGGQVERGVIRNCVNSGGVTGTSAFGSGGIAGRLDAGATIENCLNTGAIGSSPASAGGIAGYVYGTILNSGSTGTVSGHSLGSGGIAGSLTSGAYLEACYYRPNGSQNAVGSGASNGTVRPSVGTYSTTQNLLDLLNAWLAGNGAYVSWVLTGGNPSLSTVRTPSGGATTTVTVTFNGNNGTPATQTVTQTVGNGYILPSANPTRSGYTFAGWYTAQTGGTQVTANTTVTQTSNHTLWAQWTTAGATTVTVTFNAQDGTVTPSSKSVTVGSSYGTLPVPTRPGWYFQGWFTSATGGTRVTATTTVTQSAAHTLYARWTDSLPPFLSCSDCSDDSPIACTVGCSTPYDGFLYDKDMVVCGTVTLTAKAAVKGGSTTWTFSAKAVMQSAAISFSGKFTGAAGRFIASAKNGERLDVYVGGDRFYGTLTVRGTVYDVDGARNVFANKSSTEAKVDLPRLTGLYNVAMQHCCMDVEYGAGALGYVSLSVGNGGAVKIAGSLADGTKVSCSAKLLKGLNADGWYAVALYSPLYSKRGFIGGLLWLDPVAKVIRVDAAHEWYVHWRGGNQSYDIWNAMDVIGGWFGNGKTAPSAPRGLEFWGELLEDDLFRAIVGDGYFPYDIGWSIPVTTSGGKLSLPKGTAPKLQKNGEIEWDNPNPYCATLSYTAKTGLFKGAFKLHYAGYDRNDKPNLKAFSASYTGLMVPQDGVMVGFGMGSVTVNKQKIPVEVGLVPEGN